MAILQLGTKKIEAKAIILDKDGTIIDFDIMWKTIIAVRAEIMIEKVGTTGQSPLLINKLKNELIEAMGINPVTGKVEPRGPVAIATRAEVMTCAMAKLYLWGLPWDEARKVVEQSFAETDQRVDFKAMTQPVPKLRETLEGWRKAGFKVILASTDNIEKVHLTLKNLDMETLFDYAIGGNSVTKSKPDPEMILKVCEEHGLKPAECVMVGDAVTDVKMGKNAGCIASVGVLTGVTSREALTAEADVVLNSIADIVPA